MKLHAVPYSWKKTLWGCTDPGAYAVFTDWLEEQGDPAVKGLRWLLRQNKTPLQTTRPGASDSYRWLYDRDGSSDPSTPWSNDWQPHLTHSISHHHTLYIGVYNALPHYVRWRWRRYGNSAPGAHYASEPTHYRYMLYARHYRSALAAYLAAADAVLRVASSKPNERTGAIPNWLYHLQRQLEAV